MSHPNPNQDPTEPMLPEDFIVNEVDDPFEGLDDGIQREQDEREQLEKAAEETERRRREISENALLLYKELMKDPEFRAEMEAEMRKL